MVTDLDNLVTGRAIMVRWANKMVTLWHYWTATMTDEMIWVYRVLLAYSCVYKYHVLL